MTPLQHQICSLFEVHPDEGGVQRVVTPLEYGGSGDKVVVRVRPTSSGFKVDENGEAALHASMSGGDTESDAVARWASELAILTPVSFEEDEVLQAHASHSNQVVPFIFRVAEAAQQLHALATARVERQHSEFKAKLAEIIRSIGHDIGAPVESDIALPIAGGLKADHVLRASRPIIVIAASSATRLLEAEVIFMQYRALALPGYVLAVAESQQAVGRKQFERASYYTHKTVVFDSSALAQMVAAEFSPPALN